MSRDRLLDLRQAAQDAGYAATQMTVRAGAVAEAAARAEAKFFSAEAAYLRAVVDEVTALTGADALDPTTLPDHLSDLMLADDARQQSFRRELRQALYLNPAADQVITDADLIDAVRAEVGWRQRLEAAGYPSRTE